MQRLHEPSPKESTDEDRINRLNSKKRKEGADLAANFTAKTWLMANNNNWNFN